MPHQMGCCLEIAELSIFGLGLKLSISSACVEGVNV
jgi:hypothetical protein